MHFKRLILLFTVIMTTLVFVNCTKSSHDQHPCLYTKNEDRNDILSKIENHHWAGEAWENLQQEIDPYVDMHSADPEWIVSRLAMYWKEGEHYTQCYIKNQNWDYGEGNAPVPTLRLPGMRTWNNYVNVPLKDRIPFNESGDMLGIDRSSGDNTPVLVPYKESGHMITKNNREILELAEKSSFAYWLTKDEKYARFSADIFWAWLLGTYYMQPPLDPQESTNGPGGYQPGGIMGFYDYEQIHDYLQINAAVTYDFLYDYLQANPHEHLSTLNKSVIDVAGVVFKRFIDLGLIRGGKQGNWNVNGFKNIVPSMLVLESNDFYDDKKGKEYYIPYYTEITTDYHEALPDFIKNFNAKTGLWPEAPGYASGMISAVLDIGIPLYNSGINTISNPLLQKAAMGNLGWLDARGNLVVFGDMRGGPISMSVFERLLAYYTNEGLEDNAKKMATVIRKAIKSGQYSREDADWAGLCLYKALPESDDELPFQRSAYSEHHRHLIMRNGNSEEHGLMFTLYGGKKGGHLTENGLSMQFYGQGYSLAPDASAYESYWSKDARYHRSISGSNTILPGYEVGEITIEAMDPMVDTAGFYNLTETSPTCSFADVTAAEKRRLVAMVRTSETSGYYVDIFRSDQPDNDYLQHIVGNTAIIKDTEGKTMKMQKVNSIGKEYAKGYAFFKNPEKTNVTGDFYATWTTTAVTPAFHVDMWMMGQSNREVFLVDAPPTTLRSDLTPGAVNQSPQKTTAMILRQSDNNAQKHPFVAVYESYNQGEKSIQHISKVSDSDHFVCIAVESGSSKQTILNAIDNEVYQANDGVAFQGTFAITSENKDAMEYLYLGKGKLLKAGDYQIKAVGDDAVSAELRLVDGKYYYSSDKPVFIQLSNEEAKQFPAGYDVCIN